jgi:MFS family permease
MNSDKKQFWLNKPYILFLFFYMVLYEFFDSYNTSYYSVVVSYIEADFNINDSQWYLILAVASLGLFAVLGIQFLADKIGRKPMMIVAFFGMGIASLSLFLAQTPVQFTIGFFFLWMFFSSDIWVIIVSEETPKETRGRYTYLISLIGALGVIAIPVCRTIFINVPASEDPTLWRAMTYLAMAAIPLSFLGFGIKETRAFIEQKQHRNNLNASNLTPKQSILDPLKSEHKQKTFAFIIIGFILGAGAAANSTIEVFLSELISDVSIVNALFLIATLGTFVFFGITGVLADKIGRKKTFASYLGINFIALLIAVLSGEILAERVVFFPLFILVFLVNGSFWGAFMLSKTYCVECFPTAIRGTSSGWRAFAYAFGITSGSVLSSILVEMIGRGNLFILFSGLAVFLLIPIVFKKLPETKSIEIIHNPAEK